KRAIYASQRSAPRLRMELRRCQSSRSRLVDNIHLSIGKGAKRGGRRRMAQEFLSEVAAEFYVVGQPQGSHWPKRVRRRLSGFGQYRCLRSECPAADWRVS